MNQHIHEIELALCNATEGYSNLAGPLPNKPTLPMAVNWHVVHTTFSNFHCVPDASLDLDKTEI